jgi:hypothetical protein
MQLDKKSSPGCVVLHGEQGIAHLSENDFYKHTAVAGHGANGLGAQDDPEKCAQTSKTELQRIRVTLSRLMAWLHAAELP